MEEHLLEKQVQVIIVEDLKKKHQPHGNNFRAYVYGKSGFMPVEHKKRFDVLIFLEHPFLPSPIALEIKPSLAGFAEITKALHDQIPERYMGQRFSCKNEGWEGVPKLFAFTTKTAIFEEKIYTNNFQDAANFFVNRFAWRFNVGVLYRRKGVYWLSYQNVNYCLETNEREFQYGRNNGSAILDESGNRKF